MIGDFDGGSNALWTLYINEARSYDEAHILNLKDDMDGVLIFVRTYSTTHITDFDMCWSHPHRPVYFPLLLPRS
jgi:hypothetical protein